MPKKIVYGPNRELAKELILLCHPELVNWTKPEYYKGIGPFDPEPLEKFEKKREHWFEQLTINVSKFDASVIKYAIDRLNGTGELANTGSGLSLILNPNAQLKPFVWWGAGFSVLDRKADFEHWARISDLTIDEAVALSIGYDPVEISPNDRISKHLSKEVSQFYEKRSDLISRELFKGTQRDAKSSKISTETLCRWAIENKLELPPDLIATVNKIRKTNFKVPISKKNADSSKGLQNRERASMLKLIIGLAIRGYGYDIDSERSPATKQICDDLDCLGISLDPDTIRKYLKEGRDILPKDYKQE